MSAGEIAAHMIGDYAVQSDWAAAEKLQAHRPAAIHALTYAACFLPLTRNPGRLGLIAGSHFVIDRWRLARYVAWAKNQAAPKAWRYPLSHADGTGYHATHPEDFDRAMAVGRMRAINEPGAVERGPEFVMHRRAAALIPTAAEIHEHDTGCTAPVKPPWLTTWLLIACDNGLHLVCNRLALRGLEARRA